MAKVTTENNVVRKIIIAMLFLVSFFIVTNPLIWQNLLIYIVFLGISYLIYSAGEYQSELIGIKMKTIGKSMMVGLIFGGIFWAVTKLIPGFSLGLPLLPNAISDQLKFFVVVFMAPIVEEIVFRGSLLGYIKDFSPNKKQIWIAIIIQAGAFSLFHIASYISGFYSLPTLGAGLLAINSNISAFISALLFGLISGILCVRYKNLTVGIVLHLLLNLIIFTSLTIFT